MAATASAAMTHHLPEALPPSNHLPGDLPPFDLRNVVGNMGLKGWGDKVDLQTAGLAVLVAAAVVFLLKVFLKSSTPSPFGRSLSGSVPFARREEEGSTDTASRMLETLANVLDFLAKAAEEWEQRATHRNV